MKDFAPDIFRKRLIIEGIYEVEVGRNFLGQLLIDLSSLLRMTVTYGPIVGQEAQKVDPKHGGWEGFMGWAESGVHVYTWESGTFYSVDIYSCREFDELMAVGFIQDRFKSSPDLIDWRVV